MMNIQVRPYRKGEEAWVAQAHRRVYAEEYNWGPTFSDYAAKVALDFAKKSANPREALWIAEADGKPIGCIMLCEAAPLEGQLRLFLVDKGYRKFGVGTALTKALLDRARADGYETLSLWTASPLRDAIRHYEKLGFCTVAQQPNTDWSLSGDTVYEIKMEMRLPEAAREGAPMDRVKQFFDCVKEAMEVKLATAAGGRVTMRTVSPVCYEEGILIFTFPGSVKYEQLKQNPNCCLTTGLFFAEATAKFIGATMLRDNAKLREAYAQKYPGAFDEGVPLGGRAAEFIWFKPYRLTGWAFENDLPVPSGIPTVPFEVDIV